MTNMYNQNEVEVKVPTDSFEIGFTKSVERVFLVFKTQEDLNVVKGKYGYAEFIFKHREGTARPDYVIQRTGPYHFDMLMLNSFKEKYPDYPYEIDFQDGVAASFKPTYQLVLEKKTDIPTEFFF